jgi:hypothetical protein
MRTDRRYGAKALAIIDHHERNAIDLEFLNGILGDLGGLAYTLPGHC